MVDAYGDPCEDYESCLAKRMDRMALITVETVLEKVATWRERYATR
jgi:hypothetical protein